jgi:chromosome segregation ATPase
MRRPTTRVLGTLALLLIAGVSSGCALDGIQRNLAEMNGTLTDMQENLSSLRDSADHIAQMDRDLDLIRQELAALRESTDRVAAIDAEIESGVETLDSVTTSLAEADEQLGTVTNSLRDLDVHLASLRRTLQKVNRVVPFVDIVDDAPVKEPDGE